ncbi:uncharacterized protein PRCAT00002107001 [Priceomyces carsonii]|uniref:uncharacterized protein n=1 Tax=Priceomyces carsonii TaxID=28549 RepID=UPI002ED828F1|nr:unnamed protein product [Priceomyces carsonii]
MLSMFAIHNIDRPNNEVIPLTYTGDFLSGTSNYGEIFRQNCEGSSMIELPGSASHSCPSYELETPAVAPSTYLYHFEKIFNPCDNLPIISLSSSEAYFWDLYQNKFAISYPFFCDNENPFLKVVLPFAISNSDLRCALMVLSGSNKLDLVDSRLKMEHEKQKGVLLTVITNSLRSNLEGSSLNEISVLLFLLVTILLFEKINGGHRSKIENHLRAIKYIFEVTGLRNIVRNDLALFAFKNFLYNDIMNSLTYSTIPYLFELSDYDELVSRYPFVKLAIDLIKFKNTAVMTLGDKAADDLRYEYQQSLFIKQIVEIDDVNAIEWFPSFATGNSSEPELSTYKDSLAKIYKLHLLFYLSDKDLEKKSFASEMGNYVLKLPNNCNCSIAVLPQMHLIARYLNEEDLNETYFKRAELYTKTVKYPVFNPENLLSGA